MVKNIITGILIGIANIIPGVSGGTIIVILGAFDNIMNSISNLIKINNPKRRQEIFYLGQIGVGIFIGLIAFAHIIDFLFKNWPTPTIYSFIGLIIFGLPFVIKKELLNNTPLKQTKHNNNFSPLFFLGGTAIIILLMLFNKPETNTLNIIFPALSFWFLIKITAIGIIAGCAAIFPGISGALILLLLNHYHLFKGYLVVLFSFKISVLLPLFLMGTGILIGIILGAKIVTWSLKHYRPQTMSLIIGLIIASSIALIPFHVTYNLTIIIASLISFLGGGLLITLIEKIKTTKTKK